MKELIRQRLQESIETKKRLLDSPQLLEAVELLANQIIAVFRNGGKVLVCGNGGSASDALHMAGELVGRFQSERQAWPAVALNADVATMTAIANDYGYDNLFARQTEALMTTRDILIGISTGGNSENICRAVMKAKEIGGKTAALLGKSGGKMKAAADFSIIVPSDVTARIQEAHITIIHILCEIIEEKMGPPPLSE